MSVEAIRSSIAFANSFFRSVIILRLIIFKSPWSDYVGLSNSLRVFFLDPSPLKEIVSKMEILPLLRTGDQYRSLKLGYQLWVWMNSSCFIRERGLSKCVLLVFIQHWKYDAEMSFKELRSWECECFTCIKYAYHCHRLCVTTGSISVSPGKVLRGPLPLTCFWKTLSGIFW